MRSQGYPNVRPSCDVEQVSQPTAALLVEHRTVTDRLGDLGSRLGLTGQRGFQPGVRGAGDGRTS